MAHVITEPCVGTCDTACVEVCPVDCIHGPVPTEALRDLSPEIRERDRVQLFIDPEECIDCGACVPACPVDAIYAEQEVPDHWRHSIELNARFFDEDS